MTMGMKRFVQQKQPLSHWSALFLPSYMRLFCLYTDRCSFELL